MPRVQAYGQQQVRRAPLADTTLRVRPNADAYGAQLGDTLAQIGTSQLGVLMQQRRDKIDRDTLLEVNNQLTSWKQARLNDALQLRGKDAFDLPDTVPQEFEQFAGTIAQGLKNERQRATFDKMKAEQGEQLRTKLYAHSSQERDRFFAEQADAAVKLATSDAIANAENPSRIADELARGTGVIKERLKGQAPETVQAAVLGFQSSVHTGVISRLLDGDKDGMARDYFDAAKSQMTGDDLARAEKAIEVGTLRGDAQKRSDLIMAGSRSMTDALEQARSIEDPKLRDEVQQRVEHEWAIRRQAEREGAENLMVTAANQIDLGGLKAVPTSLWSQLEPGQRTSLEQYAKRHAKGADGDGSTSGLARFYQLRQMAVDNPEGFKTVNLLNDIGKLGKTEFKQIVDLQQDMRKGNAGKVDETIDAFTTNTQVFEDIIGEFKIDPDSDKARKLRRDLERKVEQAQIASGGKKLTHTEIRDMADQMVGSVVLERGSWWNVLPGGKSFTDVTKPIADMTPRDIPQADRTKVEQALRRAGKPVSDDLVLNWYLKAKRAEGAIR